MNPTKITVSSGNLFQIAAEFLNDATQWSRIAAINGLSDPVISGQITLTLPPPNPSGGNGGILFA
jgi:nucleoid-associated protein YgaU